MPLLTLIYFMMLLDGVITVQDGKTLEHEVEVIEGMKFDQGYISRHFATDAKTQECELDDADVLIIDGKLSSVQPILGLLEVVSKERRRLLIIAENVEGEALATLILNKLRGLQVCSVLLLICVLAICDACDRRCVPSRRPALATIAKRTSRTWQC
jgi:chaperonin GroEL (HSP60 family)